MSADFPDPRSAALEYLRRGFMPTVPIPRRQKGPTEKGWPTVRLTRAEIESRYPAGARLNIGILTGAPSGGLVDVDLDCSEAVILGKHWLPKTGMMHGRRTRPRSHYWYRVPDSFSRETFRVPTNLEPDRGKATL